MENNTSPKTYDKAIKVLCTVSIILATITIILSCLALDSAGVGHQNWEHLIVVIPFAFVLLPLIILLLKTKNKQKSNIIISSICVFIFLASLLMYPIKAIIDNNKSTTNVDFNCFLDKWNDNLSIQGSISYDINLNEIDPFSVKSFISNDLSREVLIRRDGKDISSIEYIDKELFLDNPSDLIPYLQEILSYIPNVSTEQSKDIINNFINQFSNPEHDSFTIQGFYIDFSTCQDGITCEVGLRSTGTEIRVSEKNTGLNFGIDIEQYCNNFNTNYSSQINSNSKYKLAATDSEYIDAAKTLVYNSLKSPSTSSLVDAIVVDKDSYGRAIVLISVDAQNSFGAYLRTYFCICIRGINGDGTFDYGYNAVTTYAGPGEESTCIELMKSLNGFEKPAGIEHYISPTNFTKEEINDYYIYESKNDFITLYVEKESLRIFAIKLSGLKKQIYDENKNEFIDYSNLVITSLTQKSQKFDSILHEIVDFDTVTPLGYYYQYGVLYDSFVDKDGSINLCAIAIDKQLSLDNNNDFEKIISFLNRNNSNENNNNVPTADDMQTSDSPSFPTDKNVDDKSSHVNTLHEIIIIDYGESNYDLDGDGQKDKIAFSETDSEYEPNLVLTINNIETVTDIVSWSMADYKHTVYLCDIDNSDGLLDIVYVMNTDDGDLMYLFRYTGKEVLCSDSIYEGLISNISTDGYKKLSYTSVDVWEGGEDRRDISRTIDEDTYIKGYKIKSNSTNSEELENDDDNLTNENVSFDSSSYSGIWEVTGTTKNMYKDSSKYWYIKITDDGLAYAYDSYASLMQDEVGNVSRIEFQTDGTAHYMFGEWATSEMEIPLFGGPSNSGNIPSDYYGKMWMENKDCLMVEGYKDIFILRPYVEQ